MTANKTCREKTYIAYILDKLCFGMIETSVKESRPILTSFTVASYCKSPEWATSSSAGVELSTVRFELIMTSLGYLQENWS